MAFVGFLAKLQGLASSTAPVGHGLRGGVDVVGGVGTVEWFARDEPAKSYPDY
jgi:hypothetical protein